MATPVKDELRTLAEQLPDSATWDDVLERLRFRRGVAEGKAAADRGEFAADEEVRRVFNKFGIDA